MKEKHKTSARNSRVSCYYCDETFARRETYEQHVVTYHNDKDPDVLCEKCSKLFPTQEIMRKHMKWAHREENIECDFEGCDKMFKTNALKNRHMISHTKERNHKCEYCPATYGHSKNLKMHREITHLGYRYFCVYPGCKLESSYKRDIVLHLRKSHVTDPKMMDKLLKELKQQPPHIVKTIEQLRKERMERKRIEKMEMVVVDEAEFRADENLGSERDMIDESEDETCSSLNFTEQAEPEPVVEMVEILTPSVEPLKIEPSKTEV